jgi:hypothetical protein
MIIPPTMSPSLLDRPAQLVATMNTPPAMISASPDQMDLCLVICSFLVGGVARLMSPVPPRGHAAEPSKRKSRWQVAQYRLLATLAAEFKSIGNMRQVSHIDGEIRPRHLCRDILTGTADAHGSRRDGRRYGRRPMTELAFRAGSEQCHAAEPSRRPAGGAMLTACAAHLRGAPTRRTYAAHLRGSDRREIRAD